MLEQQKKARRIEKGIRTQQQQVEKTQEKERNVLAELEDIDKELASQKMSLKKTETELRHQEEIIRTKEYSLKKNQDEKQTLEQRVKKRLSAYYRLDSPGLLRILFSAQSFTDLLFFHESFEQIIRHDQKLLAGYRTKIMELSASREKLMEERNKLALVLVEKSEQEKMLAETREKKIDLLTQITNEKKLYLSALKELEQASRALNSTLRQLEEKARQRAQEAIPGPSPEGTSPPSSKKKGGFAAQKGQLDPPAPGKVVTFFGRNSRGKFGISTVESGIDIKTNPGTKIRAIYDGTVIYSGFLRGYGNLVIIDHGDQHYSLMSRAEKFFVKEGTHVARGDVVGIMGDDPALLGEGLHFEIRRGSTPVNPLHWVNNAGLKIEAYKMRDQ